LAFGFAAFFSAAGFEKNQISKKYTCWRVPHLYKYECKGTIDCTAAFLSNVKYSLTFPPFFLWLCTYATSKGSLLRL
jgi:protein involved in ribonucleotide reduction